ncbi:MAG: NnrU protein [Methylococcaceae bacterium]|nr:NnrU protein [Methylococcaceae bacterium]
MTQLILAALFFIGLHFGVAGTALRQVLVERLGESRYRIAFSALSLGGLVWLIHAYRYAGYVETWGQLYGFKPVAAVLMLVAFLLAVLGLTTPNPSAVDGERFLAAEQPALGILRVTRHPFLWGMALWATTHLIVNGDVAAFILFGSLLTLVLGGMASIDKKRRKLFGKQWDRFAGMTSAIPFGAIRRGRNHLVWSEFRWWQPLLALIAYGAVMHFHLRWFGVAPW